MTTVIWATIVLLVSIAWLIGVVDIFRRHLDFKHTVAWLLIVLILPVVGTILYWALRDPDPGDAERMAAAQADIRRQRHDSSFDRTGYGP